MSIATELENYRNFLTNAYNTCSGKGAVIPVNKNLQNLASCIGSITGSGESGGEGGAGVGSSAYNVYSQMSEPDNKNGVWFKSSDAPTEVKFYDYSTATGEFLEAEKFSFIDTTGMSIIGQEIIDGHMYLLTSNNTSKKINLKTKTVTTINTPTIANNVYIGTCYYKGRIYIFNASSNQFFWKYYDIATDTSSEQFSSSYNSDLGTMPSNDTRAGVHVFDGKAYAFLFARDNYIGGDHVFYAKFDLETNKHIGNKKWSQGSVSRYSSISGYGQYVYFILGDQSGYNNSYLKMFDLVNETYSSVETFSGTKTKIPYATANEVYAFEGNGAAQTQYLKYNLLDKTTETITASNTYFINQTNTVKPMMLDDMSGILYFRSSTPCGMQLLPSPELDTLAIGTLAIIQSPNNNSVKIQDSSNLHIGVDNVYKKTSNGLETGVIFLGDGVKWYLLRNATGETAIVTFNTDGGSEIESQEVVLGQKLISVETPTKTGYAFVGWYKDGEPFDFNTPITGDITLTAVYEEIRFIEYIESNGTQYIDTGILPSSNIKLEIDYMPTVFDSDRNYIYGAYESENHRFQFSHSNIGFVSYGSGYNANVTTLSNTSQVHHLVLENRILKVDGVQIYDGSSQSFTFTTYTLYLFNQNSVNGVATAGCRSKIFASKIYDGDTLVRDFKPALDSNGVACLYDTVTGKCFYNKGTGEFETPIEGVTTMNYIESTGTQYIDTGIKLTSTHKIVFDGYAKGEASLYGVISTAGDFRLNYIGSKQYRIIRRKTGASDGYSILSTNYTANVRHVFKTDGNKFYIDNTLVSTLTSYDINCDMPLYIFGINNQGTLSAVGSTRCYSLKIYDGDTLVRDYKPALDDSGVACLYDKVSETFFYNQGTGTFTAG